MKETTNKERNFIYKMYDVYKGIYREEGGGGGVAIGKLPHPNILYPQILQ